MEERMEKIEKKGLVDLHFHSAYSDGSEDIPGIMKEARDQGLIALALTDYNNGVGVPFFLAACKKAGISALEGTETYVSFSEHSWSWNPDFCGPVPDVTILGKKLNWQEFRKYQEMLVKYWLDYWLPETLNGLRKAGLKVPVLSKEQMWNQLKDFGVPRVLHEVPKNPDNWDRLWEICVSFEADIRKEDIEQKPVRWANKHLYAIGKEAYVLRAPQDWTVKKAVELAEAMGGVLFAAHPGGEYANWSDEHLDFFIEQGGRGIEVYQYWHLDSQIRKFKDFAAKHGLLVSGGSDWHGKNGRPTLGCWDKLPVQTPLEAFNELFQRLP